MRPIDADLLKEVFENIHDNNCKTLTEMLFFDGVIVILDEQPTIKGWIHVSERLPEEGIDVLVWYKYFRYGDYNRMFQTFGIAGHYKGLWGGDVQGTYAECSMAVPI